MNCGRIAPFCSLDFLPTGKPKDYAKMTCTTTQLLLSNTHISVVAVVTASFAVLFPITEKKKESRFVRFSTSSTHPLSPLTDTQRAHNRVPEFHVHSPLVCNVSLHCQERSPTIPNRFETHTISISPRSSCSYINNCLLITTVVSTTGST